MQTPFDAKLPNVTWQHIGRGVQPNFQRDGISALPSFEGSILFICTPFDAELPNLTR